VNCRFLWIWLALGAAVPAFADSPGWRASIGTRVSQGCNAAVTPAGIEALLTAGLRDLGITVSTVYNSQLSVEVDCVAVSSDSGAALATHECLDFAELVQTPSTDGRSALASTWRKCATSTCARARCDAGVRGAIQDQIRELSAVLQERVAVVAPARVPEPERRFSIEVSRGGLVLFYSLYIAACLSLIVYWQVRRQAY
jgi:hypothetical protein